MTDVIEIMARALFEQQHHIRYGCDGIDLWDSLSEVRKCDFIAEQQVVFKALNDAGWAIVPREPTGAMIDKGEFINSEWLNDIAPLNLAHYRKPAEAVYKAMLAEGERG